MRFKLAGIQEDSIVDGPGFRLAVFVQGCDRNCPGCHNPSTHDREGGRWEETENILRRLRENPLDKGLTLSGGEPFLQPQPLASLAKGAKALGRHVMAYTGFLFEELLERPDARPLLEQLDLLVDGPYVQAQRSLELRFRGSANQRILDVPASLREGRAVCLPEDSL